MPFCNFHGMVTPVKEKIHQAAMLKYFGIYPTVAEGSLARMQVNYHRRVVIDQSKANMKYGIRKSER
jgi:hypothetical protein